MHSHNSRNLTVALLGLIALYAFLTLNKVSKLIKEQMDENRLALITLIVKPNIDPTTKQPIPLTKEVMDSTKSILEQRLNTFSKQKWAINIDDDKINILPRKSSKDESLKIVQSIITRTELSIHLVHRQSDLIVDDVLQGKEIPGYLALPQTITDHFSGEKTISHTLIKSESVIDEADITIAKVTPQDYSIVNIELNDKGGEKMQVFTQSLTHNIDQIATVLNSKVINSTTLNAEPIGKQFVIKLDSEKKAEDLARALQNPIQHNIEIIDKPIP